MFDRTDWNTREQGLQDAIRDFEQLLDRMGQGNEESSRLREVVRRLERRVFDLEDQLKERDDKNREALRKLDALAKEMTDWTQNEPLP